MLSSRPAPALDAPETGASDSALPRLALGALTLLLLVAPYELSGFWPGDYDLWPQALFLLLGAGGALLLALSPATMPRFDATACLILAFLGWCALATVTGVYRHDSLLELARICGSALTFFALRAVWTPQRSWILVLAWCVGVSWLAAPTLLDFLQTRVTRQSGPFSNENIFANALAMTIPLALIAPILLRRRFSNGAIVAAGALPFFLSAAGLLITASKGGFAAALLGAVTTILLVWRARQAQVSALVRRHRTGFGFGALIFLLLFGAAVQKTILPRLQTARSGDNSTVYRVFLWRSTLDIALAKPLTGWGTGDWRHVYQKFAHVSYTRHAHQSWLQIAAEDGWPALVLLLGAVACALRSGFKRLQSENWPLIAGAAGAVVAMLVHGSVDSGFLTTSVSLLFFAALGLLTADENRAPQMQFSSRLNPFWLGATLLLAWGGWQSQKTVSGASESQLSAQFLANGAPSVALQRATTATELDSGAAPLWLSLGRLQEASGIDGRAALQTAAQLQPTVAANWANLARAAERHAQPQEAEAFYARALGWGPLDTQYLLERAEFRLSGKNSAGYADLEKILALWDAPLGKYPPVESLVNLDFARATLLMAPELKRRRQTARLQTLVKRALSDCARAQSFEALNEQLRQSVGAAEQNRNADLAPLTAQLKTLQPT